MENKVRPSVQSKLETILTYPFFQSVGKPISNSITTVDSWPSAIKFYTSVKWENCRLMARNVLQRLTEQRSWHRSNEWNSLIDEIQPVIELSLDAILPKVDVPPAFIAKIKPQLSRDIKLICLENEYSDIVEPSFFLPLLEPWYAAGHLPCGWDGTEFPEGWDGVIHDGRLIVF